MPTYILCGEDEALRIRDKPKVLQYPIFPKELTEYQFSKVLLFYPLLPGYNIDLDKIGNNDSGSTILINPNADEYYYAKPANPETDYNGKKFTIIETNER